MGGEEVVTAVVDTNPKTKFGALKPNLALIPSTALVEEAVVFGLGAKKYGPYNWREKTVSTMTYLAAGLRHLHLFLDGENIDPESGALHLSHARACMAIVIDAKAVGNLIDDRPPAAPTGDLVRQYTLQFDPPAVQEMTVGPSEEDVKRALSNSLRGLDKALAGGFAKAVKAASSKRRSRPKKKQRRAR